MQGLLVLFIPYQLCMSRMYNVGCTVIILAHLKTDLVVYFEVQVTYYALLCLLSQAQARARLPRQPGTS